MKRLPEDESTAKKRRRALDDDEIERLRRAAKADDSDLRARFMADRRRTYAERHRRPPVPQLPLWRTLLTVGLRWGEAASAMWSDFNANERTLTVQAASAKGRRSRIVPLPVDVAEDLDNLRDAHVATMGSAPAASDRIFLTPKGCSWTKAGSPNALRTLRRLLIQAGIDDVDDSGRSLDLHALRTTAITRMLRHGVPLEIVAEVVGHQDVRLALKHYTDLRVKDTRNALDK